MPWSGMPVFVDADTCGRFVILRVIDPYTFTEWHSALVEILASFVYASTAALLVDHRQASAPTVAFAERMFALFKSHARELAHGRAAIVTERDGGFGTGRMTQLESETGVPSLTIHTFQDYEDAVRWLTSA